MSSPESPWLDPGEHIGTLAGNREGFELLRDAINQLLANEAKWSQVGAGKVGIEAVELVDASAVQPTPGGFLAGLLSLVLILGGLLSIISFALFGFIQFIKLNF